MLEDEGLYGELLKSEYADQAKAILDKWEGDIDNTFLGFTGTYKLLAQIIPTGRTVIDLGCAYAFQSWYFRHHKLYVGVDVGEDFLRVKNGDYYTMDINRFIETGIARSGNNVFAICNYVPTNTRLLRETFENLFVFYPEHGDSPLLSLIR